MPRSIAATALCAAFLTVGVDAPDAQEAVRLAGWDAGDRGGDGRERSGEGIES